ncbi:MAG: excinuclease ABC subunit UvrC, partial [Gammaproteobacteria bacterium]
HRGTKRRKGEYFGPYPSAGAVRSTLHLMQKVFKVRQCRDSYFRNRSRPCLQYQIKRCTAPCVGYVSAEDYARDVRHTEMFLEGKSNGVIQELGDRMAEAAEAMEYEQAAVYRDQIARLRRVFERQYVSGEGGDLDIVACALAGGTACVQVFVIRDGRNLGNRAYYPKLPQAGDDSTRVEEGEVLGAFIAQHYLDQDLPGELILSHKPADAEVMEEVFSTQAGRRVKLSASVRGERARWLALARENAEQALGARLSSDADLLRRYDALQDALGLDAPIQRMECFDISHTMGESTVASCVVFDPGGPLKSDYRRFNIKGITGGDDYAAMDQALRRRYRERDDEDDDARKLPDLLIIDGGKGQLTQAEEVLEDLGLDRILLLGIAKGVERKPGWETLILGGGRTILNLGADSPALHLLQQIRDEAHRFAITGHRQRRQRSRNTSRLEEISGLGPKRRQSLLKHFGGLREVAAASVEELAKAPGVSRPLAERIHAHFHE